MTSNEAILIKNVSDTVLRTVGNSLYARMELKHLARAPVLSQVIIYPTSRSPGKHGRVLY